jgi:hypothetical protein
MNPWSFFFIGYVFSQPLFLLTMKYIYSLRHLLEPVQFTFALPNKAFAVADKFPQLALVFVWGYNWPGADRV